MIRFPGGSGGQSRWPVIVVYTVFLLYCCGKIFLYQAHFPPGCFPDEIAQASYVHHVQQGRGLDLSGMHLLKADGSWSKRLNYLNHPPFFYLLVATLSPTLHGADRDALIRSMRPASAGIALLALTLMLTVGALQRMPLTLHVLYAATISTVPNLVFVSSGVNNDALANLGGALCLTGMVLHHRSRWLLVMLGLALAASAKVTAALLCGVLAVAFIVQEFRRSSVKRMFVILLSGIVLTLPALLVYGHYQRQYGSVAPSFSAVHPDAGGAHGNLQAEPGERTGLVGWSRRFAYLLGMTWVNVVSHCGSEDRGSVFEVSGLLLLPALMLYGLWRLLRRASVLEDHRWLLLTASLSVVLVLGVHLVHSFRTHLATGWMGGVSVRYYFPLLPAGALLAAAGFEPVARTRWGAPAVTMLLVSLLYSDVFSLALRGPW